MSKLLIVSVFMLFIKFSIESAENKKDPNKVVEEAVTYIDGMIKEYGGEELESVVKMTINFGQLVPVLGQICGLTFYMLNEKGGHRMSLKGMYGKLERIEDRINLIEPNPEEIRKLILTQNKRNYFVKRILEIDQIIRGYQRYIDNPTAIHKESFARLCDNDNMFWFMLWIYSEVVSERPDSLLRIKVNDLDMRTFIGVAEDLILIYTRATYAHALCLNAKNYSEESIDLILGSDLSHLEQNMHKMRRGFEAFDKEIKTMFWQRKAREEIQTYMNEATGLGLNELADHVLRKLELKYYWKVWIVISYNVDENPVPQGIGSKWYYNRNIPYSGHFLDSNGRGLFVGSREKISRQIPPYINGIIKMACFEQIPSIFYPVWDMPEENWPYINKCWTEGYVNGEYCAIGTRTLGKILEKCKPVFNNKDLDYQLFVVIRNDDKIAVKYSESGNEFNGYGFGLIHRKLGYFNRSFKIWYPFVWWFAATDYLATPMYDYVWKSYSMVFFYNYK